MRVGRRTVLAAQVSVTPLGLIAIGALVSAILLSVPPIVRAAGDVRRGRVDEKSDRTDGGPSHRRQPMTEKKGKGSETAQRANAKAAKEGQRNPRKSSAAQAELGRKGGKAKKG